MLFDRRDRQERRTALIARLLRQYQVDIATLSETRLEDETQLEEVGGGYAFYCIGKPENAPKHSGVGFAIRTQLARRLKECNATIVSAYAPTMANPDEVMEAFYEELNQLLSSVDRRDKLIILGDFNARVGVDYTIWPNILGRHGAGKCNSNDLMLLSLCAQHELTITNTLFQQADKLKNTWMHPRSKQWHMLDYLPIKEEIPDPPTRDEVAKALKQTRSGKAPGADGIPADVYKNGGQALLDKQTSLFQEVWKVAKVTQDFKDAAVVHIYKRKGDKTSCDNHGGYPSSASQARFWPELSSIG
ncbi:craniofacial development protein 2-like [Xenia sp. Carnegie-2017]|uniref:craniofacial development protein 2-like n=1 Tax=Xenia sp. Carnegie-2017 TaxID=2897299 RepID=UPI001F0364B4|nr:craniofacial development protein 2-like [Xenia sp. Carnegie-2017]